MATLVLIIVHSMYTVPAQATPHLSAHVQVSRGSAPVW